MDRAIGLGVAMLFSWGCASSAPHPTPVARPFDDVHRVAIIVSGESTFAVAEDRVEPGRTFDEILKWHPYGGALRPVAKLVPYRTPRRGVYICSAATPPGGGVHGMCGFAAARVALRDLGMQ